MAWWYNRSVPRDARQRRYRSAAEMRKHMIVCAGKDSRHFAITSNGKHVGYVGWNDHMEVFIFIGHPYYRGLGIGTKAMRMVQHEFRRAGKQVMSAKTNRPDFWIKLGFRETTSDWRMKDPHRGILDHLVFLNWRAYGPS